MLNMDFKLLMDTYIEKYKPNIISQKIRRNHELLNWLKKQISFQTDSIPELIFLYKNPLFNPICKNNQKRTFHNGKYLAGCGGMCECSISQTKQTFLEKYGTDTISSHEPTKEKKKKTFLKKHGVSHSFQSESVRKKIKQTNLMKYGVENVFQSEKIKQKIKQTNLMKYGSENPLQNQKVQEKLKNTNLKKYGVDLVLKSNEIKQRIQKTNLEKYGSISPLHNNQVKEKIKKTILEKYGVDHVWKCSNIRDKIKNTILEKYGVDNPNQNIELRKKSIETNMKKYGVENFNQMHISKDQLALLLDEHQFKTLVEGKTIKQIQEHISVDATTILKYAEKYDCLDMILRYSSYLEDQLEDFCKTNNIDFLRNTRKVISPLELDFYFPKSNTAIECHGLYWHSEIGGNKTKQYHFNKWNLCREKGIDLYQYFEDEIVNSFEVIKSKILYVNNKHPGSVIGARKLFVDYLKNYSDELYFYKNNHVQGVRIDRTHAIGAWVDSFNLVACMSVKHLKVDQLEIVRFATDISNRYPGVFTKMLNWYVNQINFKGEMHSWSDNRHSNGHLYQANGFKYVREQKPGYFVTDYQTRWRREHFMKARIKERHPHVDLSKTEWQLEQQLGYDRIWDAGKVLWKKSI
jgi:hypothetical protein